MQLATELGGTDFATHVHEVGTKVRAWSTRLRRHDSSYWHIMEIAGVARNIHPELWEETLGTSLLKGWHRSERIYVHKSEGLYLTDKLVGEYKENPEPAIHWLTMVVHFYLLSASAYRLQVMAANFQSQCEEYALRIAPFALHALHAQWRVSVGDMDVARHMQRRLGSAMGHMFPWLWDEVQTYLKDRFRKIRTVIGLPRAFYSPLSMEKLYSYLPTFKEPFVTSFLDALEAKANNDIFNYNMARQKENVSAARWRLLHVPEAAESENFGPWANALYVKYYMVAFIPSVMLSWPYLDAANVVTSYAGLGFSMAHEMCHTFDKGHFLETSNGYDFNWTDVYSSYAIYPRMECITRLYDNLIEGTRPSYAKTTLNENIADIAGMELTLAAIRNDSCYHPEADSALPGFKEKQLFFIAHCYGLCATKKYIHDYEVQPHPRYDHRCNVVSALQPEFREAFGCPNPRTEQCRYLEK